MDQFRRSNNTKKRATLDGFVPNNLRTSSSVNRTGFRPQVSSQKVGGSYSSEGFMPSSKTSLNGGIDRPRQRPNVTRPATSFNDTISTQTASRPKKRFNIRKVIKRAAIFSTITVVLLGGVLIGKGYLKFRNIFKGSGIGALALNKNVDPTELKGEGDGRVNVLLLGRGGEGHEGADLTDTLLIASIDPIQNEASLLSVPRDLYVTHPAGGKTKINAVYSLEKQRSQSRGGNDETVERDGANAVKKVVSDVLGIPIHYYMMVDFKAFEDAINAVDGITFDVTDPVYEKMSYNGRIYTLDVKTGLQQFDGLRALMYTRSRYTSARGDFDRAERQRKVIIALKDRVLSVGTFTNPGKLNELIDAFGDHVTTDFSQSEMLRVYDIGKSIDSTKIASLSLVDPPNNYLTTSNVGGLSVVIPIAGEGNYKEIQNYVRNTLKDAFIKNENANIVVLNGTKVPGLATKKAEELRSFGYNVTFVGNTPTDSYQQTVLVDMKLNDRKYTKRYLEQRLKVTALDTLPDSTINQPGADFVIILGSNETSTSDKN